MVLTNRRIEMKVGRTINLGNYESERIDISLGGTIEDSDDEGLVYDEIFEMLNNELNNKIKY